MFDFPDFLQFSITEPIDQAVAWLLQNLSGFFDAITAVIVVLFNVIQAGLLFVPWFVYVIAVLYFGIKFHGIRQGITLGIMMTLIGVFGLWDSMIYTLVIVIISVLVSLVIGLPLGIAMAKNARTQSILKPLLDGMQTMPSFVYLIPAVMLFGLGRVPAVFATTIYAVPPLIRLTYLGITNVDKEVVEAGKSFGSTARQLLFKIELPQALPTIMTGVNQTTMMAMAMVVISSMIGAEGIGSEVLVSIRRLEVGRGFQAGFAIVFLAIVLDRLLQGWVAQVQGARSNG
jgi:ABC-type proline/glycine betaine transport system, permease component